jgi:hypothetical protein
MTASLNPLARIGIWSGWRCKFTSRGIQGGLLNRTTGPRSRMISLADPRNTDTFANHAPAAYARKLRGESRTRKVS